MTTQKNPRQATVTFQTVGNPLFSEKVDMIEHSAYLQMKKQRDRAVMHLKECCKHEPDGIGGFVSDEFTEQEVLDGRVFLKEIGELKDGGR